MLENYIGKIINADCMDILKQLPDKSIDLVVTSPPSIKKTLYLHRKRPRVLGQILRASKSGTGARAVILVRNSYGR